MRRTFAVITAIIVLLGSGALHGLWTDRWQDAASQDAVAAQLAGLPLQIGPWQGTTLEVDQQDLARAGYAGCVWRRYENRAARDTASVLLVAGQPGRVSVHTPEVCYKGAGYELVGEPERCTVTAPSLPRPAEFWKARFVQPGAVTAVPLRIYWSWYAGAGWEAPKNPRMTFARVPVLYKLYVIADMPPAAEHGDRDACSALMQHLLPQLRTLLAGPLPGDGVARPGLAAPHRNAGAAVRPPFEG
jgi:hypothetical protein